MAEENPLLALAGKALELALDRVVALDPSTRDALLALEGRELALAVQAPPLAMRVKVQDGKLRVGPDRDAREADLSVKTTLGALLGQLLPGREGAMPVGQVRISGDAELARRLQQIVQRYQPDIEEAFAKVFGDVIGVQLARALKRGLDWSRDSAKTVLRDTAEYLGEESRDLVPKAELSRFLDEVDELRDAAERLERRIARTRGRIPTSGGKSA
jgi:ubiquinone biosynthesis accessory factor UbiJ